MLTVAFVLSSLQLLATAGPVDQEQGGLKILLSKPAPTRNPGGVANIEHLRSRIDIISSKYDRGFNAYKNNHGTEHPLSGGRATSNTTKRATGVAPLKDDLDGSLWQGTISVGTPSVKYTVDFDTGSSDIYLPGPSCTENCAGHKVYDPSASSSSEDRHQTFTLTYGDHSSVSGEQYTDIVTVAGLTAGQQTLGAASTYSAGDAIDQFPSDGLVGMAYQSISVYNSPPLFQTLIAGGQTTQPVFAFKLAETGSELSLGGVNSKLYTGSFTFTPVTHRGYWQVDLDAVSINNKVRVRRQTAVIDTGTSLVIGPSESVNAFYHSLGSSKNLGGGIYTIPCYSVPTVSLTFGGKSFAIAPSLFNQGPVSPGSHDCIGGIMGADNQDFWVVGDLFLQNVYTQFDLGNNRVGFAKLQ